MVRKGDLGERRWVWWCPDGNHIDEYHHTEGSYLDICSRCGGVCEKRSTAVVQEHRRRRRTPEEVAEADEAERKASEIKVYRGEPFRPTSGVATVDAHTFDKPPVEPPFELTDDQRKQLLRGDTPPTFAFPRMEMPKVAVGDVVEVTDRVKIAVLGFKDTVTHRLLQYEIHDERSGRLERPFKAGSHRRQPGEVHTLITHDPKGGSSEFSEPEPEPVGRKEASAMARVSKEEEIAVLRSEEKRVEKSLSKLEEASTGEVTFQMRITLNAIKGRRERLERSLRKAA
jgi:hypothetical protein